MNKLTTQQIIYLKYTKRALDLFISALLLLFTFWVFAIIALAILLTDGRPIVFKQERIGYKGKPFTIYKFRTMVKNAEQIGARSTGKNDPRVTTIGRILRHTSLDELAQIINVIKGDMSYIGYRPGVRENYTDEDFRSGIFDVRPGITGYAQVNGRSNLTVQEVRKWEMKYVEDISFITDVKILFKTIKVVFTRTGVN